MSNELTALGAITDKVLAYRPANKEQSMKSLLKIHQQGPDLMADSRAVAQLFGIQHKNLRELIETHSVQLEQLGIYRFQTAKLLDGAGRPEKFAYLNFDHIVHHITKVTALLQAATSKTLFYELFAAVFYGQKQLLLGQSNAPDEFA